MAALKPKLEKALAEVINDTPGKPSGMNVYAQSVKIEVDPSSVMVAGVLENMDDPEGTGNRTMTVSVTLRSKPVTYESELEWFEKSVYFGEDDLKSLILEKDPTLNANLIVYGQMFYTTDDGRKEFISTFNMDINISQLAA